MRRRQPPAPAPVPFSPAAARAHRTALGLTVEQVADGLAAHGVRLLPGHVLGWEDGLLPPTEEQLTALARTLWCPPARLMGTAPATLRDHRIARELTQDQAARLLGLTPTTYRQAETTGRWTGNEDQTRLLARVLALDLPTLIRLTGRTADLDARLRQVVQGRWQAQLHPVARLVPVAPAVLEHVLAALQSEHHTPTSWGAAPAPTRPDPTARFWHLLAEAEADGTP
ncbi:helix-turn-helix domain-containing protein [Kitasatospora sp. YST-16]|uniref:helix-turn-helix domain-containing protein n=1 Tax=Kitasatospora sp. YST-16 TaxID=2998080 RepID=UPI0022836BB9|nr:helix-turn-helix domain-containing protein [Kitasatospora sp. YST-16]WAL74370.1 helix-turn-helix domain-containing protein [Kitasatospora sp. YST-16]WNW40435.1 helix-turn-helix domain-containing protein [Streptomyces sp. Li-HN-5-13]